MKTAVEARFFKVVSAYFVAVMLAGVSLPCSVGQASTNDEQFLPAVQQTLTPSGKQVELLGSRPQALALSPNGKILVTSGKSSELIVVDPVTGEVLQEVDLPSEKNHIEKPGAVSSHILEPDEDGQLSFTGLIFSRDGREIFLSNVNGSIKVFGVEPDHRVKALYSLALTDSGLSGRKEEIPAGLAISPDGKKLYLALNLSNRLLEYDLQNQKVLRLFLMWGSRHSTWY